MYVDGEHGSATLTGCTISGNTATSTYGGLATESNLGTTLTANLIDTIVAGNSSGAGSSEVSGSITASYCLFGPLNFGSTLKTGVDGNIVLTSEAGLDLGPLADNGGPTQTMALLPGSPAIEEGIAVAGLTADQRGMPLDSPYPDIGAFQVQDDGGGTPIPTFAVTSTADDGSGGTLRWAIAQADADPSSSTIEFDLGTTPTTITLTQGTL